MTRLKLAGERTFMAWPIVEVDRLEVKGQVHELARLNFLAALREDFGELSPADAGNPDHVRYGRDAKEAREFSVKVQSDAFRPSRLRVQDGPSICFERLKQELEAETEESRTGARLSIGEREIEDDLVETLLRNSPDLM